MGATLTRRGLAGRAEDMGGNDLNRNRNFTATREAAGVGAPRLPDKPLQDQVFALRPTHWKAAESRVEPLLSHMRRGSDGLFQQRE
jgi:hypothetical protein